MNTMVMCSNTRVFIGEACKYCVANRTCSEYKEYLKEHDIDTRSVFKKILDYMRRL